MVDDYRSNGRRKSRFPAQTSVPSGASFDYVSAGVNYKISYENLLTSLNATGSIVQGGAVGNIPILNKQGGVNVIRGLEIGTGILAAVTPENGISFELNLTQSAAGAPVSQTDGAGKITLRGLQAGDGIQINEDSTLGTLTIEAIGDQAATNVVRVNSVDDFPTAVGGVITLEPNTTYDISNDVTTANRFVMQAGTSVVSSSFSAPTLTSTTTGAMFTSDDVSCSFNTVRVDCPNGTIWDLDATTSQPSIVVMLDVFVVSCQALGTADDLRAIDVRGLRVLNADQGFVIRGAGWQSIVFDQSFFNTTKTDFVGIDLNGSVTSSIKLIANNFNGPAGAVGFDGTNPAEDNITANNIGVLQGTVLRGGMGPFGAGFNPEMSIRWNVAANDQIPDSRKDALIFLENNATTTVIPASNTPVLIAGTWQESAISQFSATVDGRLTYDAEVDARLPIDITTSISKVGGGTQTFSLELYKNGVAIGGTRKIFEIESGQVVSITTLWQDTFSTGDYYELFVENLSNANNVLVQTAVFRIN